MENTPNCSVVGCPRKARTSELCGGHYERRRRTGSVGSVEIVPQQSNVGKICRICEDSPARVKGTCIRCYNKERGKATSKRRIRRKQIAEQFGLEANLERAGEQAADGDVKCFGPECDRKSRKHGMCDSHYRQWRNGWDELVPVRPIRKSTRGMSVPERLEHYANPAREDGCRYWTGPLDPSGYPIVTVSPRTHRGAHRVAWELANNQAIPAGMQIHHTCSVPVCVEPSHLQMVTQRENIAEMKARNYFEGRIRDLELALADFNPDHPLLAS